MAVLDILARLFGDQPQSTNRFMMAGQQGPNSADRFGWMLSPRPQAAPDMAGQQGIGTYAPPQAEPMQAAAPQRSAPSIEPPARSDSGGGFGGFVQKLFDPNAEARNVTVDWLQKKGYSPDDAKLLASNKPMLQAIIQDHYKSRQPTEFDQRSAAAQKYGLTGDQARNFTLTGELPKDAQTATDDVREYEYAKQRGEFNGTFTDWQTKSTREQDPTFQREMDLRQQYDALPEVKDYKIVKSNYERIRKGVELGTGAGDAAIVFGYMKMLDPGSVVREGEQANAQNAAGVPEGIRGMWNRVIGGGILSAEARNQILSAADGVYGESSANIEELNNRYSGYASNYKLDPNRVVSPVEKYDPMKWTETDVPGVTIRRKQ